MYNYVGVLKTTELYTLGGWIVWCMNISIKLEKINIYLYVAEKLTLSVRAEPGPEVGSCPAGPALRLSMIRRI